MTITSENYDEYLLIRSVGKLTTESDLFEHATLIYTEFAKYDNKKMLLDALATEFPMDLYPYYNLVQFYIEKLPAEIKELKLAAVISAEYTAIGEFWQTVANNRGFQYMAFTEVRHAEEWLLRQVII
jgi:hypothetical protein